MEAGRLATIPLSFSATGRSTSATYLPALNAGKASWADGGKSRGQLGTEIRREEQLLGEGEPLLFRAIAYLLQTGNHMYSDPMEACDIYTRECSIGITTRNLAVMGGTLANGGVNPVSRKRLLDSAHVPKILAEMAVEGLYDTSGAWQYDVGLPAKSGVGGGIMAVSPGNWSIAAFSPPLDGAGNSVRAQLAIAWIAEQLKANIYVE